MVLVVTITMERVFFDRFDGDHHHGTITLGCFDGDPHHRTIFFFLFFSFFSFSSTPVTIF